MSLLAERLTVLLLVLLCLLVGAWAVRPSPAPRPPVLLAGPVRVRVIGAVRRPGLVDLVWPATAGAAVAAAGGLSAQAAPGGLPLGLSLDDGATLRVPSRSDWFAAPGGSRGVINAPGGGPPCTDLNSASTVQLVALPGVGEKLAARIVAARPLSGLAALDAVRGVGPILLGRLAALVCQK